MLGRLRWFLPPVANCNWTTQLFCCHWTEIDTSYSSASLRRRKSFFSRGDDSFSSVLPNGKEAHCRCNQRQTVTPGEHHSKQVWHWGFTATISQNFSKEASERDIMQSSLIQFSHQFNFLTNYCFFSSPSRTDQPDLHGSPPSTPHREHCKTQTSHWSWHLSSLSWTSLKLPWKPCFSSPLASVAKPPIDATLVQLAFLSLPYFQSCIQKERREIIICHTWKTNSTLERLLSWEISPTTHDFCSILWSFLHVKTQSSKHVICARMCKKHE